MNLTNQIGRKAILVAIALALPFVCLKLAFVSGEMGFEYAPPLFLILGIVIGTCCAIYIAEDSSYRPIIGIIYVPAMLFAMYVVGLKMSI